MSFMTEGTPLLTSGVTYEVKRVLKMWSYRNLREKRVQVEDEYKSNISKIFAYS